jgi:hypothetical protein
VGEVGANHDLVGGQRLKGKDAGGGKPTAVTNGILTLARTDVENREGRIGRKKPQQARAE